MEKIIGRETELGKLNDYFESGRSEFIALYGRRRVGKTFLIRSFFKDKFDFYATGVIDGSRETEIISRMETFQKETGYKGGIQASIVTTFSLQDNMYSEISPIPITLDELFVN